MNRSGDFESCMFWVLNIPGESSDRFPVNHSPSLRWIIYNGYWCLHKEGATEALWRKAYILFITFGRRWTLLSPVIATVVWHHLCSQELGNWFSCRIIWMKTTQRWIQMSFVTESCLPWQSALNSGKFVLESDKPRSLWHLFSFFSIDPNLNRSIKHSACVDVVEGKLLVLPVRPYLGHPL